MYKNSSALLNNTTLWVQKHLDSRCENNNTPGVLIEEIWYKVIL